jgi:cyclophilin family peptidyl-prolyl cis-trans isomerase
MLPLETQRGATTMERAFTLQVAAAALACSGAAFATDVAVCTDQGRFLIELADEQSPKHVENFLRYVDMSYYSGKVFHRVMPGFVVQGGGLDRELRGRPTLPPVPNESRNGLSNVRGSVSAARTADPDSATSQFFVNLEDNTALDAGSNAGYTVFGRVKEGLEVVDSISRLPTGANGPLTADVPMPLVVIKSIARLDEAVLAALPEEGRDAAIKQRITEAATAQDYAEALRWVAHYRAICGSDDAAISVIEAQAALATNDQRRAVFVLEEYFVTTERDDPTYADAVALYGNAVPENRQSAAQLADDCVSAPPPQIPDGAAATMEQMVAGQTQVKEFVAAGEVYLACLSKIIDDEERSAADRNAAIGEHNRMVAAMEQTASEFNAQLRAFKAK